ncbi:MAG TPA: hypothetical protein VFC82_03575 [Actinomycetaceae bacterium]|nr:hypothetical protein [Actinomycetaceae bacterium]
MTNPEPKPQIQVVDPETAEATRKMFRSMLKWMLVLLAVTLVAGVGLGWLAAGMPGVWAALLGCGITGVFTLTTVGVGIVTADKPMWVASAALLGGWLAKAVILLVVLVALRGQDFYDKYVLFATVAIAVLGSVVIEAREALRARIPYTSGS